jgi:t-SNARE complex subunit (syntaxin)
MINLMPDAAKKEIKAARSNGILARWSILILIIFGILVLVVSSAYLIYVQANINGA